MEDRNNNKVRYYETLVQSRYRAPSTDLMPDDHRVDWNDAPSKYSIYSESVRVPLSTGINQRGLRVGESEVASFAHSGATVPPEKLSDFLLLTAGILRRKLLVNWTLDGRRSARHHATTYARGTASGGGLYPVIVYPVLRNQLGTPGVYHYDCAHHELTRLRLGNMESSILRSLSFQQEDPPDFWIVLTVNFWRSAFKYHNFAYQVVTQDVGATIGAMELIAHSLGWTTTVIYWFHDQRLGSLLGLNIEKEAPFAVLSLRANDSYHTPKNTQLNGNPRSPSARLPQIHLPLYERSQRTHLPKLLSEVHRETLIENEVVIRPELPPSISSAAWPLVPPRPPRWNLLSALDQRETIWGLFRRTPPLVLEELKQVLQFVVFGTGYYSDLYRDRAILPTVRVAVIGQDVDNLPRGVYDFDPHNSGLSARIQGTFGTSLQCGYRLPNHNLDQVSAVLVIIGHLDAVLGSMGGRGIRVMSAEAGIAAQRAYIAAAALSLGCAAALGFDGAAMSEILDLDTEKEIPLLLLFIGRRANSPVAYDFSLV